MAYPDKINALVDVSADETLAEGGHAARHNDVNEALEEVRDLLNGGSSGEVLIAAGSLAAPVWGTGGKILQIVRATDSTERSTTSTSFQDTSLSVTITPQKSDSVIILITSCLVEVSNASIAARGFTRITDSSNNAVSGAESCRFWIQATGSGTTNFVLRWMQTLVGYATPATTSATTYKLRFRTEFASDQIALLNDEATGQMYAIEVSA